MFADEIHRAHQRCMSAPSCDPSLKKLDFVLEAGEATMKLLRGAYSCVCLVKGVGVVAFRDPFGVRPLVLGRRPSPPGAASGDGYDYCVASEDCAFGPIGFERVRDVAPGEMVVVTDDGRLVSRQCAPGVTCPCIYEYIYLARPDSVLNGISVYNFQLGLGTRLAAAVRARGWAIDCVVPVPDGSRPAAIQISAELGLPYREGLVKNRYVGRTFIMPDQRTRELSVRRKLNAMPAVFEGRNVLLVDDLTETAGTLVNAAALLKSRGAEKILACVSHTLLNDLGVERLKNSSIDELITTDSVRRSAIDGVNITTLSVAGLLGEAIKRIHSNSSVTSLFEFKGGRTS